MVREAIIKVVLEGTFSITVDLRSNSIELHNVLVDLLPIVHDQAGVQHLQRDHMDQSWSGAPGELLEVVLPKQTESPMLCEQKVQFKPFQGHTFQVQLCEDDLNAPHTKSFGRVLEIEFKLH